MEKHLPILNRSRLFLGLSQNELLSALSCLNANVKEYNQSDIVLCEGDLTNQIGIVLSGEIEVQKIDFLGNANIISRQFAGGIIAAAVAFSDNRRLPFDIVCVANAQILFLDNTRLIKRCHNSCGFHTKIIENMLTILAEKNIQLTEKIDILTKRTIREKIIAFLYSQSKKSKSNRFSISLTRRQLADFLSVNRSAMIRELTSMRQDGVIGFENNIFWFV